MDLRRRVRSSRVFSLLGVQRLVTTLHSHIGVADTVQAVAELAVKVAGFGVAAVSIARGDGQMEMVAVAGSTGARHQLLGTRKARSSYDVEFGVAEVWGRLLFVPHERLPDAQDRGWIPEVPRRRRFAGVLTFGRSWHPLDALYAPLRSASGDLIGILSVDLPVGGRRPGRRQRELLEVLATQAGIAVDNARLTNELRAEKELFKLTFDGSGVGMALISLGESNFGRYLQVNAAFCEIVGRGADELLAMTAEQLLHEDDRPAARARVEELARAAGNGYRAEKRQVRPDGEIVWVASTVTAVDGGDGSPRYAVAQIEDITGRRAHREELKHRAHHDPLTDLPNRAALLERLRMSNEAAQAGGRPGALLFLDLNDFKEVNDRYGHHVGDQVLTALAARLKVTVDGRHMAGRLGGDEFLVIADGLDEEQTAMLVADLVDVVAQPLTVDGTTVSSTVSIGSAPIPVHPVDLHDLITAADRAMYVSKRGPGTTEH